MNNQKRAIKTSQKANAVASPLEFLEHPPTTDHCAAVLKAVSKYLVTR